MAVVAGGAGATALITALNSAKTVKSTKAMLDNTKELNKAMESGALDSLNQMFQGMMSTGPVQSAFQVLFAQIQAGTTAATVELMNELLLLINSPNGQITIKAMIELMVVMVDLGSALVRLTNDTLDALDKVSEYEMPSLGSYVTYGSADELWDIPPFNPGGIIPQFG